MEEKNDIKENKNSENSSGKVWNLIISGRIFLVLSKHFNYILFVFLLVVFYIAYRYKVEDIAIKNKKIETEAKTLQTEYIFQSTELMRRVKKNEILKQIQERNLNLKEAKNPFIKIKVK
jgi:hypothetical protein